MKFVPVFLFLAFQEQPLFRSEVALVHVDAEVRVDERVIDSLTKDDFRVTDGGKPREILYFGHQEEPLDVILLLDTSGSMKPVVDRLAETARSALGELRPGDRVAVMTFDRGSDLILDFTEDLSAVEQAIRELVSRRRFGGSTLLHGGLSAAALHFVKQPRGNRRRTILAVTDDQGTFPDRQALRNLWEADAVATGLIVRGLYVSVTRFSPVRLAMGAGMGRLAERTGGDMLGSDDVGEGLREMIRRLRLRYSLYYSMPQAKPGQERRIRVELTKEAARRYKGAKVRARTGYIAAR